LRLVFAENLVVFFFLLERGEINRDRKDELWRERFKAWLAAVKP